MSVQFHPVGDEDLRVLRICAKAECECEDIIVSWTNSIGRDLSVSVESFRVHFVSVGMCVPVSLCIGLFICFFMSLLFCDRVCL